MYWTQKRMYTAQRTVYSVSSTVYYKFKSTVFTAYTVQ